MPQPLMGSACHRVKDRWAIMGNLGWQDWSRFGSTMIETRAGITTSRRQLKDTWHALSPKSDFGVALEYARAGSSSDPSALISGRIRNRRVICAI